MLKINATILRATWTIAVELHAWCPNFTAPKNATQLILVQQPPSGKLLSFYSGKRRSPFKRKGKKKVGKDPISANFTSGISLRKYFHVLPLTQHWGLILHNSLKCLVTPCFFYIFSNIYLWCKAVPNISNFSPVEVSHANSSIYL